MSKIFDLSTLNLSAGTHEITVKARASGYDDSPASNAVSYVVQGDMVQVSGTWYFNEDLGALKEDNHFEDQTVSFTSNNTAFTCISEELKGLVFGSIEVYFNGTWINEAYRTITFEGIQTVSKEFYEWLVENAMRPVSGTWKFKDDISDIAYDEGFGFRCDPLLFKCNGTQYYDIEVYDSADGMISYGTDEAGLYGIDVYRGASGWRDEAYRTITFDGTQYMENYQYELFVANAARTEEIITDLTGYTLIWDDYVAPSDNGNEAVSRYRWYINFNSNNQSFVKIIEDLVDDTWIEYHYPDGTYIDAYDDGWNEAYKTIQITGGEDATNPDLIKWFKTYGILTKTLITFTIEDTTYYAKSGMTWDEWVKSEYNTGGFYATDTRIWDAVGYIETQSGMEVKPTDNIIAYTTYSIVNMQVGGSPD